MSVITLGENKADAPQLVWAHGWGQSAAAFVDLARTFERRNQSLVLDLPGFGDSGLPPEHWGTAEYAEAIGAWLCGLAPRRRVWIGHSYGCRVGVQIAARYPNALAGMVLVAAAGLPRRRTALQWLRLRARIYAFKLAKSFTPDGPALERLRSRFGSADSRNAGPLRSVLVRAVNENLSAAAAKVRCPTVLIYGQDDDETPPEIGHRYQRLIPGAELQVLKGFDHHTILTAGRHQVGNEIRRLLGALA
jgi:pimeloyl-ACP methyl ester carboxylesterase